MNKNDVIIMLERLKSEFFFSDFKLKKSDKSLIRKFDWGWQRIRLDHYNGFDLERNELALEIRPMYDIRFNIYHRWFERFSVIDLKNQRDRYTIGFSEEMLGKPKNFHYCFLENRNDYERDYEIMKNNIIEHASSVFKRFQTLNDVYDYRISDLLKGNLMRFNHGGDWIFEDMFLARMVSPQNYLKVKEAILERFKAIYNNPYTRSSHMEIYHSKASEIISYLESIPLDNVPIELIRK